jgi:biotin transporter BioY
MEAPTDGVIRQPSWGRLGLEVLTDLVGWVVVFAILQVIGIGVLHRITGPSLVWELLLVLILFFAVTIIVRVAFILLARRATH